MTDDAATTAALSRPWPGSKALKVHDKILAIVSSRGDFVVKLPKACVEALVDSGAGGRFEASQGRLMKEWLQVDPASG